LWKLRRLRSSRINRSNPERTAKATSAKPENGEAGSPVAKLSTGGRCAGASRENFLGMPQLCWSLILLRHLSDRLLSAWKTQIPPTPSLIASASRYYWSRDCPRRSSNHREHCSLYRLRKSRHSQIAQVLPSHYGNRRPHRSRFQVQAHHAATACGESSFDPRWRRCGLLPCLRRHPLCACCFPRRNPALRINRPWSQPPVLFPFRSSAGYRSFRSACDTQNLPPEKRNPWLGSFIASRVTCLCLLPK